MSDVAEIAPWERQPGETAKAYAAFVKYREMPTLQRSQRELAADLGHRDPSVVANWSRKQNWVARVEAYDQHRDSIALQAQDNRIRELAALRADVAVDALVLVVKRLRGDEESGVQPLDANTLSAKDIGVLAGVADKIGASLDRVSTDGDGNRDVNLKVSFDMTPHVGKLPEGVVDVVDAVPVHAELPKGDE